MKSKNILNSIFKKDYIFQSILIFVSVFLGMMVSNWNENLKEQKKAKVFLQNLVIELKANQKLVKSCTPYHEKLAQVSDSLYEILSDSAKAVTLDEVGGFKFIPGWKGLGMAGLSHAVYESGLTSGIFENIPIELLTKVSRIQLFQEEYTRLSRSLSDKLLSFESNTKIIDFIFLTFTLGYDVKSYESRMVKGYDQLIEEIEKNI